MVATPTLGSLGTLDTSSGAKKDVVSITREGTVSVYSTPASACSPSSWPNFHHDIANSGDYTRDAIPPGLPRDASIAENVLHFTAPGDDLLCGTATRYEVVTSESPIAAKTFASATPLAGPPAPAAAGTAQSYTLPAGVERYVAIRAVDDQGNVGLPASAEYNPGAALPSFGRCVKATAKRTGEWEGARCINYAHGKGTYNFLPGPGAAPKVSGGLGATSLETTGKAKISCASGTGVGEYTGARTLTITLTLSGCERASNHQPCQSVGGASGQIVTNALEGTLGFINAAKPSVGLDLAHEPSLASFECTAPGVPGKELLTVEGSVIGQIAKLDEMASGFTITFTGRAGKQTPEAFEGGATDTLLTSTVGRASEPSVLTSTLSLSDEEPLELKAKA
jgi:hypothetical protein